jgi:FMN phosphatase YigB (HAD superfamily)
VITAEKDKMIQSICFDFGGTLARLDGEGFCQKLARFIGRDVTEIQPYLNNRFRSQCLSIAKAREALYNDLGFMSCEKTSKTLFTRQVKPILFNDVIPALHNLEGYHCGILSNTTPWEVADLGPLGISHFFSVVLYSFAVGATKPDVAAFQKYQASLRGHGSIIMVGDSLDDDIDGARKAGWIAVYLDREGNADASCNAHYRIQSLSELPDLLRTIQ